MKKQKIFTSNGELVAALQYIDPQTFPQRHGLKPGRIGIITGPTGDQVIAGPTGDQVIAPAIAAGKFEGILGMDRVVLTETLQRLVSSGKITQAQADAAMAAWKEANNEGKEPNLPGDVVPGEQPDPIVPANTDVPLLKRETWTVLGLTMKPLWWVLSGVVAVVLLALVVKKLVKK